MKYRALVGINYRPDPKKPDEVRLEEGDVVDNLPEPVVKALGDALEKVKG